MSAAFRFAPDFRRRLHQLAEDLLRGSGAVGDAGRAGRMPGRVEFRDHRAYVAGDDLRFLDWNVFLRSGALAVKTFEHEEAPEALVILDRSASMGPLGSRQDVLAREVAAAIGFLALRSGGEAVLLGTGEFSAAEQRRHRGSRATDAWIAAVEAAPAPAGRNALEIVQRLAPPPHHGRVVAWISDFLDEPLPAATFAALARASAQRCAYVLCAHDDALARSPAGDAVMLGDAEGDRQVAAQNDVAWRAAFTAVRSDHVAAVAALATRHQFVSVAVSAETGFEDAVLASLKVR